MTFEVTNISTLFVAFWDIKNIWGDFKYVDGLNDKQIVVLIDVYAKQKKWKLCNLQIKVLKAKAVPNTL